MKIYAYWSADTTYYTTSSSIKKAKEVATDNYKDHLATRAYLGEEPDTSLTMANYFLPYPPERVTLADFLWACSRDADIAILDDELHELAKAKSSRAV